MIGVHLLPDQPVLVVGDLMLDEHIWGNVRRISPEAPVPVVEVDHTTFQPGGAANVAANIVSLGGRADLVGVVGADSAGQQLCEALARQQVGADGLVVSPTRCTTTKSRVLGHSQHMLRLDREKTEPLTPPEEQAMLSRIDHLLPTARACILSDYAKGVLTERICQYVIAGAAAKRIPVIVDPKSVRFDKYRGATVVTPNWEEARRAMAALEGVRPDDHHTVAEVGAGLLSAYNMNILVTRGAEGMSLFQLGAEAVHIPSQARSVYDVTGAGDTVVASLTLALASEQTLIAAARIANLAAGLVVGKVGTATVTLEELNAALRELRDSQDWVD